MGKKLYLQIKKESPRGFKSVVRITKIGLEYLYQKSNLSQEEIAHYPGTLEELCATYGLKRGRHFTVRSRKRLEIATFNVRVSPRY